MIMIYKMCMKANANEPIIIKYIFNFKSIE